MCWRIDTFKLWCWRRRWRVLWIARISNQLTLREINPEFSLEGLVLKLKLHYFGYLTWRANSLEKTLMLGKSEEERRSRQQRMRWLDSVTNNSLEKTLMLGKSEEERRSRQRRMRWLDSVINLMEMNSGKLWEIDGEGQRSLVCCSPWSHKQLDMTYRLNNDERCAGVSHCCFICISLMT